MGGKSLNSHFATMTNYEDESHMLRMGELLEAAWETGDIIEPLHQSWTIYFYTTHNIRKMI